MKYDKIQERVYEVKDLQFRAVEEDGKKRLEGYAALYNVRSKLLYNSFYEVLERGAFDDVLQREDLDVVLNFNHDNSLVMGRTTNGTLKLTSDENGLFFRATLPNTSYANDVYELVQRGDIFQNSFAFMPAKDGYTQERLEGENADLVTITKVAKLRDVSAVTFPAYAETTLQARAIDPSTGEEIPDEEEMARVEVDEDKLKAIYEMSEMLVSLIKEVVPEEVPEEEPTVDASTGEEEMSLNNIDKKKKFLKLK